MQRVVKTIAGDSVNRLLWRELRRDDDSAEEALWSLNPGLAAYGPLLPAGIRVVLPDLEQRRHQAQRAVTAWD
ncbi:tail protein X [Spirulina subsalsa FACHB-351]|uniref:Tail protein X n=1 Tax=Spirulina subsalsa FACHB-351 TaxID=234711 RepID=A0ABT3L6X5_9CYAN|nr:tail protein X [Spirulina subsalsa]MCW6036834.1 tail protein X [Spirulina subsalsa FACHB-351]